MIYKGCEKRMIMLKNTGSELFEEAYFILNNKRPLTASQTDMVKEANRIIAQASLVHTEEKKPKLGWIQYAIGFLCGVGFAGIILAIAI